MSAPSRRPEIRRRRTRNEKIVHLRKRLAAAKPTPIATATPPSCTNSLSVLPASRCSSSAGYRATGVH